MKRRILIALAVVIPLGLFLVARNAASWRPQSLLTLESVDPITNLQVSPAGRYLVPLTNPGGELATNLYDLQSGQKLTLVVNDRAVWAKSETKFATLRGSIFDAAAWPDPGIALYDLPSGRWLLTLKFQLAPEERLEDGAFVEDDRVFLAVSQLRLWRFDVSSGALLSKRTFRAQTKTDGAERVQLFPDGTQIWRTAQGHSELIDASSGRVVRRYPKGGTLLPDARFYFQFYNAFSFSGGFQIYRVADGKQIYGGKTDVSPLFAPDGKTFLTRQGDLVQLHEMESGRVVSERALPANLNPEFAGPNHLLAVDGNNRVTRWRLR